MLEIHIMISLLICRLTFLLVLCLIFLMDLTNDDMPFVDTTTYSWNDTMTSFKYGKFVLLFSYQLF
jgi:hypothetical protein